MNQYTGTDNLEVMEEAVNYCGFLLQLIEHELNVTGLRARQPQGLCVDFGAGIGTFAKQITRRGANVQCVETDAAQMALMQQQGFVVHASLAAYADDSIDFLYTFNVMEHIDEDRACFGQMHRKLKKGGRLLVYVPAFQILFSSMDRKVGHVRRYTRQDLAEKVTAAGFRVVDNSYVDSIGFFVTLLYKLIGSDSGDINRKALIIYDRVLFPLSRLLDRVFGRLLGKNVFLVAEKPRA